MVARTEQREVTAFGRFLRERWERIGISQAEFSRRIGKPAGWVQQIREGSKTPPLREMKNWGDAIDLNGPELQRFMDLAAVAHLPREAQPRFLELLEDEDTQRQQPQRTAR